MWISMNNAFLSIVQPPGDAAHLVVRARRPGDLQAVFPGCKVVQLDGRDYQFRTTLPREQVAAVIAQSVLGISYGNFKNSVRNRALHDAYADVWRVMSKLQPRPPYSLKAPAKRAAKRAVVGTTRSLFGGAL